MLRRSVCAWEKLVIVESPNKVIKVEGLLSNPRVIPDWSFGKPNLKPISTGAERAIAMATTGHFMSLRELTWTPQSLGTVQSASKDFPANGVLSSFSLEWELIPGRRIRDTVSHYIEEKADNLTEIIVATDPDREGELIAVHAQNLIRRMFPDLKVPFTRAYMHSITEDGIRRAMEERHEAFDYHLANAAEARHAMDRIFGFLGSSVVRYANPQMRSIGRVQTPALILINDREAKIKNFLDSHGSTYDVQAMCHFNSRQNQRFSQIVKVVPAQKGGGSRGSASDVDWKDKAAVTRQCEKWGLRAASEFRVSVGCKPQENVTAPPQPFTMATLISKANRQLHYSSDMVSSCLQDLFQMGFITYPRTDSTRIDESVLPSIYSAIRKEHGKRLLQEQDGSAVAKPGSQRSSNNKTDSNDTSAEAGNVEDAHEAIRPTDIATKVEDLGSVSTSMKNIYDLVRRNTLAAFMIPMRTERVTVPITCKASNGEEVEFQLQGKHVVEPGWTAAFRVRNSNKASESAGAAAQHDTETDQDVRAIEDGAAVMPNMSDDEFAAIMDVASRRNSSSSSNHLRLESAQVVENKPLPPLPYSEGGLIEQLRSNGVGRPSTYPMIVKTLLARNYITVTRGRCETTPVGRMLVETSRATFPSIVDIGFTAAFEKKLDRIAKPESGGSTEDDDAMRWNLPKSISEADFVLSSFISIFLNYVTEATKAKRAAISTRSLTLQHEKLHSSSSNSVDAPAFAPTAGASALSNASSSAEENFKSDLERETKRVTAQVPDLVENMKMYRTFTALQNSLNDYLRRNFPASSTWSNTTIANARTASSSSNYSRNSSSYSSKSSTTGLKKAYTKKPKAEKKKPRRFQEKKK
ncbi:DNA topoisomerase 1A [Leptomonas pyrrhocoris]|uniref:DNA topoisomerase n=1 Tax=Leptomonas pyrrhocoris TaxID=157538 RepID=A0A0M9FXS3_LEPPY|nr:DNA topoisomerase 1A [Leptomonas pyrrhocoris]KPA78117.1 DNA topoisomerase 1A [Leptomonas pyrrhocoris]|eukprot:XP_015656556.1 DNA topoisomerase 1A [Leptomonas pyrrhocoris]